MADNIKKRTLVLSVILAAVAAAALTYAFTSREVHAPVTSEFASPTESATPVAVPSEPVPAPAPLPVEDKIVPPAQPTGEPPLTLKALQFMPANAQLAVGIPAPASLIERVVPFVQKFVPADIDLAGEIELIATDLAVDMEVPAEGGLVGVLAAMGIDSRAGMGVFLDMVELAKVVAEASAAGTPVEMPDLSSLKGVLVLPVNDPAKAEASLIKLLGELLSGMEQKQEQAGNVVIKVYEGFGGYFVCDAALVVGNDLALLKGAAERIHAPAEFQYGSPSCPADDIHEAVALVYGDRLMPLMELFSEQVSKLEATSQVLLNAQIEKLRQIYAIAPAADPVILTCRVGEESVELKTKIDTEKYPALLQYMGPARPLRWAQLLPMDTKAFLSINFTEEAKKQITDVYLESIPENVRNQPGVSQGVMYGNNALQLFGGEITVGAAGLGLGFPSVFLMIELADNEGAEILLRLAPQADHQEPYRDIQLKMLQVPLLVPIYFAIVDDALVMSNSDDGIRKMIDHVKDGTTSGFFESLNPPVPPDASIYQALLIKPSLYTEVVAPMTSLTGQQLPAEAESVMSVVAANFEDIRLFNEMQGRWSVGRIFAMRKAAQ